MRKIPARNKNSIKLKKKLASRKKIVRHFVTSLSIFLASAIFLTVFITYKFISHNLASAMTPSNIGLFESGYPSVLFVSVDDIKAKEPIISDLEVRIYDYEGKKVIVYNIPPDTLVDTPGRLAEEKLGDYFRIAHMYSEDRDVSGSEICSEVRFLQKGILKLLAVKPERFLVTNNDFADTARKLLDTGDFTPLINKSIIENLGGSVETDISFNEFLELSSFTRGLPADRVIRMDLDPKYGDQTEAADLYIRDLMLLSRASQESYSIAILNATDREGLATFGSRVIGNNGGRVVAVSNANYESLKSVIISDDLESVTVRKFASIFGIDEVLSKAQAGNTYTDNEVGRADMTIILGFDLADTLY